jgi:predicted outer membrane repeat protein
MRVLVLLVLLAALARSVAAQAVVTACGRDDAAGGLNLRDAVAAGGAIVIRCAVPPQTIQITATRAVAMPTTIDGGGNVTITGDGAQPMFSNASSLTLANVTVRNPPAGRVVAGGRVTLRKVRTENTNGPYVADVVIAEDSTFENNGDPSAESSRTVIDAERTELRHVTFTKNADHPIGGGATQASGRTPGSRTILIEDSTFTDNTHSILAMDATLTIRRTVFENNGVTSPTDGSWGCCAGAITIVRSTAAIEDGRFSGNSSSGFGGAILAIGSRVTIARTLFEQNSARVGGAMTFWGQSVTNNVWSSGPLTAPLVLTLDRARFHGNVATEIGGALAWSGSVGGDSALFQGNRARRGGAVAHWTAAPGLPAAFADVFPVLSANTQPLGERLALARGIFVENEASEQGGALDAGASAAMLGNALVTRNRVTATGGTSGALAGQEISLVNSTVVGNNTVGVVLAGGGRALSLVNSIVADNAGGNCAGDSAKLSATVANLQYPGATCGTAATQAPRLDERYAPGWFSPARNRGDLARCVSDALVGGHDLYGKPRGNTGACAIGAVEPDVEHDLFSNTPFGDPRTPLGRHRWWWVFWIFVLLLLLAFIWAYKKARRARTPATP